MTTKRQARTVNDDRAVTLGREDAAGGVAVWRLEDGQAVILPARIENLSGEQKGLVADLQRNALAIRKASEELDARILLAREAGISWDTIGWSVGLTGQAVRKRLQD